MIAWLSRLRAHLADSRAAVLDHEIETHIDLLAADLERRGMSPASARVEARRQFGGITQIREICRDQRRLPFLETLLQDLRYAARQLRANPGFAIAAVLTLALGIGANTAIFRVLDAIVLRSLPVHDPASLVILRGFHNGKPAGISYPLFREMAARQQSLEGIFAFTDFPVQTASVSGAPLADVKARLASGGYFRLLGATARLGRLFTEADDQPAAPPVAIISYRFWQTALQGRDDALGRTIQVNQAALTIVGVTAPAFFGERVGSAPDVWVPLTLSPQAWIDVSSPGVAVLSVMGRLRPGIPAAQARPPLELLYDQFHELSTHEIGRPIRFTLELTPGGQGILDLQNQFARPLTVLMAIVALVLLIASSNLANLLLARATARTHEIGVRLALGAGRSRLIRQLLTESLLLASLGAILGLAFAAWGSRALLDLAAAGSDWRISLDFGWRVLAFTTAISAAAVCLFGLAPALAATRMEVHSALQSSRRAHTGGRAHQTASRAFIVAQVAVSLLLVAGASLLVRSFWNLWRQDFGYRADRVLMVQVPFDFKVKQDAIRQPLFDRMNSLPGVRSAALSGVGPLGDFQFTATVSTPDRPADPSDDARVSSVSPRYFETMGIPILAGRPIADTDQTNSAKIAVLSQTAARRLFGGTNSIGRAISLGRTFNPANTFEVVGVAHDLRFAGPRDPFGLVIYRPLPQMPAPLSAILLRTDADPARLIPSVRQALRETAPRLQTGLIQPLNGFLGAGMRQERMMALISGAFALLALVLASVGLYGVIAYGVVRRTQEIGIRLALGAGRAQISRLLFREVALLLSIGLVLGGAGIFALGGWLRAMLFGLTPRDPGALALSAALLSVVAIAAAYIPARRAARLDPLDALRQE